MDRHPDKEINAALEYAKAKGWVIIKSKKGHCWGMIRCPFGRAGCQKSIWSTPKNPQNHAKAVKRFVDKCPHSIGQEGNDENE